MSKQLREAALRHLHERESSASGGTVQRLTVDVEIDGRTEMVSVSLRNGELQCISSDGNNDGPHVQAALQFIAGTEMGEAAAVQRAATTAVRTHHEPGAEEELADALDDLLTAVTRVGVKESHNSPSVDEALQRMIAVAPDPMPLGLARFVGRLRVEMQRGHTRHVARLLDGAARLATALRSESPSSEAEQRVRAWLGTRSGSAPSIDLLYDRTLIEVGREWLAGTERASLQRRLLVDRQSGRLYREDRPRHANASLGPCPRQLNVGLAEVERGPDPQRIRILQYEVSPEVPTPTWDRLRQVASRDFGAVIEDYRRAIKAYPTLGEPFALISPHRVERNGVVSAFDPDGNGLLIAGSDRRGVSDAFGLMLDESADLTWVLGRLSDRGSRLCISPFAFATRDRGYTRLR